MTNELKQTYCGFVAIIGRPNVGKSTLLNHLIGEKVSITSRKAQTTRHKIYGIKTHATVQIIYCDTPGLHQKTKHKINEFMVSQALQAIKSVDVVLWLLDANQWHAEDDYILAKLTQSKLPLIIALNKIDTIKDKTALLPKLESLKQKLDQANLDVPHILLISAKNQQGTAELEDIITKAMPASPFLYAKQQITDKSKRFQASEIIREKLMRHLGQEVPHTLTVEIQTFKQEKNILHIHAIIWVERKGQKVIIIGKNGEKLKQLGRLARLDLENQFNQKIYLNLWVKIKSGWTDDIRALTSLGYHSDDDAAV
ncbi:MAG: GTPase Era [Pseudomonadota bacterium]